MPPRLYTELADWWPILSRFQDYAEEAALYRQALESTAMGPLDTLLELGSGGGNNAHHLAPRFRMTLVDLAPGMLAVSRALNPGLEHVQGDMRDVRLGRTFDAVFVHDAISYMTTRDDLGRAIETAAVHCRPGGVVLLVPDDTAETWRPSTHHGGYDGDGRALRYLEWKYDPDLADERVLTAFAFLLREGNAPPRLVSDLHEGGLFPRSVWLELMDRAGLDARTLPYRHSEFAPDADRRLFVGVRRAP